MPALLSTATVGSGDLKYYIFRKVITKARKINCKVHASNPIHAGKESIPTKIIFKHNISHWIYKKEVQRIKERQE